MREELIVIEDKSLNTLDNIKNDQNSFLQTNLGMVINTAVDIGLKSVLPDLIEDEVINIKDSILENGLKEGINEAVKTAIDFGKSAMGIVTGNFEDINQIDIAIKKGGMIDNLSDLLDSTIKTVESKNVINKTTAKLIKQGKNNILNSVTEKIKDNLENQTKNIKKIEEYSNKWKEAYEKQDFNTMSKSFKNMQKYLKETVPLEKVLNEARKIENLHNLIKNKGENFNITEDEMKIAQMLIK